jgi:hypothetical protein
MPGGVFPHVISFNLALFFARPYRDRVLLRNDEDKNNSLPLIG